MTIRSELPICSFQDPGQTPLIALLLLSLQLLCLASASPSQAAGGVLEINQVCATSTGCFPGDAPGFPVTIDGSAGRSFRLTSDLQIARGDDGGVEFVAGAGSATLDLGGFAIRGSTQCTVSSGEVSCAPTGVGRGVVSLSSEVRVTLRNGSVIGMGWNGVQLNAYARVHDLHVAENGGDGIILGWGSLLSDSVSTTNGDDGIVVGGRALIRNTVAGLNGRDGFSLGPSARLSGSTSTNNVRHGVYSASSTTTSIEGNTLLANDGNGIDVGGRASVHDNSVQGSEGIGIAVGDGSVVSGNTVGSSGGVGIDADAGVTISGNSVMGSAEDGITAGTGSAVRGNSVVDNGTSTSHDGIHCTLGCLAQGNTVRGNAGYGLRFNSNSSGYSQNTIGANGLGEVLNGRDAGGNVCGTSLGC